MIRIAVSGPRTDKSDWEGALDTPKEQLPPLTPEQRKVVEQMHIREEDYQRSVLARRWTAEKLLKKTELFAKLLQRMIKGKTPSASIRSIVLDTLADRFEIAVDVNGTGIPLHIPESVVEDLFNLSVTDAEQKLSKMVEECFHRLGVP
jgi:hypothetical protein